jgi:hypothetical protein
MRCEIFELFFVFIGEILTPQNHNDINCNYAWKIFDYNSCEINISFTGI